MKTSLLFISWPTQHGADSRDSPLSLCLDLDSEATFVFLSLTPFAHKTTTKNESSHLQSKPRSLHYQIKLASEEDSEHVEAPTFQKRSQSSNVD